MKFSDPYTNIKQMHISPGMHVADFGSGVGFYSLALADAVGHTGMVFAIDVQADHLSKLKREALHRGWDNVEVIQGDLEKPAGSGLIGSSVDRIVISNVLFQVQDPFTVATEAMRVIKPSGFVAVIDWTESFNQIGPHKDQILEPEKLIKVFETVGFEVVTRLDSGSHHYGYLFRPKSHIG